MAKERSTQEELEQLQERQRQLEAQLARLNEHHEALKTATGRAMSNRTPRETEHPIETERQSYIRTLEQKIGVLSADGRIAKLREPEGGMNAEALALEASMTKEAFIEQEKANLPEGKDLHNHLLELGEKKAKTIQAEIDKLEDRKVRLEHPEESIWKPALKNERTLRKDPSTTQTVADDEMSLGDEENVVPTRSKPKRTPSIASSTSSSTSHESLESSLEGDPEERIEKTEKKKDATRVTIEAEGRSEPEEEKKKKKNTNSTKEIDQRENEIYAQRAEKGFFNKLGGKLSDDFNSHRYHRDADGNEHDMFKPTTNMNVFKDFTNKRIWGNVLKAPFKLVGNGFNATANLVGSGLNAVASTAGEALKSAGQFLESKNIYPVSSMLNIMGDACNQVGTMAQQASATVGAAGRLAAMPLASSSWSAMRDEIGRTAAAPLAATGHVMHSTSAEFKKMGNAIQYDAEGNSRGTVTHILASPFRGIGNIGHSASLLVDTAAAVTANTVTLNGAGKNSFKAAGEGIVLAAANLAGGKDENGKHTVGAVDYVHTVKDPGRGTVKETSFGDDLKGAILQNNKFKGALDDTIQALRDTHKQQQDDKAREQANRTRHVVQRGGSTHER